MLRPRARGRGNLVYQTARVQRPKSNTTRQAPASLTRLAVAARRRSHDGTTPLVAVLSPGCPRENTRLQTRVTLPTGARHGVPSGLRLATLPSEKLGAPHVRVGPNLPQRRGHTSGITSSRASAAGVPPRRHPAFAGRTWGSIEQPTAHRRPCSRGGVAKGSLLFRPSSE